MPKPTNHPFKTFVLLLVVAGLGWLSYEFIYVRGILKRDVDPLEAQQMLKQADEALVALFESDLCFAETQPVSYRANSDQYIVRFTVAGDCTDKALDLCKKAASVLHEVVDGDVSVFAYNRAGNPLAQWID